MSIVEARAALMDRTSDVINRNRWEYIESSEYRGAQFVKVRYRSTDIESGRGTSSSVYAEEMESLCAFARENELLVFGYAQDYFLNDHSTSVYYEFYLSDVMPRLTSTGRNGFGPQLRTNATLECPDCETLNSIYSLVCSNCDTYFDCNSCGSNPILWETRRVVINSDRDFIFYNDFDGCTNCTNICGTCNSLWHSEIGLNSTQCYSCDPRFQCRNCGVVERGEESNNGYCEDCTLNICADCENFFDDGNFVVEEDRRICQRCFNSLDKNIEVFDDDSEMPATRLAIPTIEGRERIRFCGIEIEGINILAEDFFDAGLSAFNNRRAYHERYEGGFVHVERDSSCDWEVVAGPMNMAGNTDVRNLNRVIRIIRERIKDGTAKLSLNCGLHIHVSGEKVGLKQSHNLHLLYTYMEDIMYRIGAAKWPMHRAVVNGDHSYQLSPRREGKVDFVNTYMDNRYHGLSFSNYFQKVLNHCACGAGRFGLFEDCTCSLTKCTFEFRIFNTTANTRKIHAYTALTQALVAKALSMTEFNVEEMPALGFNMRNVKDLNSSEQEKLFDDWMPRMKYILEELPLTNDERDSILYCVENSELAPMMGYCTEIMNANAEVVA